MLRLTEPPNVQVERLRGWRTLVRSAMTAGVETMKDDESVQEAARRMRQRRIRRLLIEDINRRIVGVVTLGDLAAEVPDAQLTGKTLEEVSQPAQ